VRAASLAAAVAILALTGCGGSGGLTSPPQIHLTAFEKQGKAIFIQKCGICHQLADARTSGTAGPTLAGSWAASRVRIAIAEGKGAMRPNLVTGRQAAEVAAYVAAAAR
jgi:mono/diheme cytochrome c family protein